MEQYFIDFLNSSIGAGTLIAVILGGITVITGYIKVVRPLVENQREKIKKEIEREKSDKDLRQDLKSTLEELRSVKEQQNLYHASMQQYEEKLCNVLSELDETKKNTDHMRNQILEIVDLQNKKIEELQISQKRMNEQVDILIESDKEDIKAYITKEYHYWVFQRKEIDAYSLASIEARFESYKKERGNTFVKDLVEELRKLPKSSSPLIESDH